MSKTAEAVKLAVMMANDPRHGYDQDGRWGPDFDCSSFLIHVWEQIGVKLKSAGASYTGNVRGPALRLGFVDVTARVNLYTGSGLQPGDLLLNYTQHMAMYVGNGQLVHASINEKGTVHGGQPGDQTGREICVRSYYNHPWDCALRYSGDSEDPDVSESGTPATVPAETTNDLPLLKRGMMKSVAVKSMQGALIAHGYDCGPDGADGDFGENTEKAVIKFKEEHLLQVDGEFGPECQGCLWGVTK